MAWLIIPIHLLACIALIAIVLLQTGKGAEMGAAFGGASQTLFGGSGGSSFMSKLTTGAAIVFMITCLLLSFTHRPPFQGSRSVMSNVPASEQPLAKPPEQPQPVVPEARPVQPETAAPAPQSSDTTQKAAETPSQPAAKQQPKQGKKKAPETK